MAPLGALYLSVCCGRPIDCVGVLPFWRRWWWWQAAGNELASGAGAQAWLMQSDGHSGPRGVERRGAPDGVSQQQQQHLEEEENREGRRGNGEKRGEMEREKRKGVREYGKMERRGRVVVAEVKEGGEENKKERWIEGGGPDAYQTGSASVVRVESSGTKGSSSLK